MTTTKHTFATLSRFHLLAVMFLSLCFLATSLDLSCIYNELRGQTTRKGNHGPGKRDGQIPYEEKELGSKIDQRDSANNSYSVFVTDYAHGHYSFLRLIHAFTLSGTLVPAEMVPLYLVKRTLLI